MNLFHRYFWIIWNAWPLHKQSNNVKCPFNLLVTKKICLVAVIYRLLKQLLNLLSVYVKEYMNILTFAKSPNFVTESGRTLSRKTVFFWALITYMYECALSGLLFSYRKLERKPNIHSQCMIIIIQIFKPYWNCLRLAC